MIQFDYLPTPFGRGIAALRGGRLALFRWDAGTEALSGLGLARRDRRALAPFRRAIAGYFAGRRVRFGPLALPGTTPFARRVYAVVARIPYGEVRTYGEVADAAGRPGAARAVGTFMARNPLCLAVPCHRVVAAGGRLGGFGGRPDRKRRLLALEGGRHDFMGH